MKLLLCPNGYNKKQSEQAKECIRILSQVCGHECSLSLSDSLSLYGVSDYNAFSAADCDIIVSLGGDGSVLRAAVTAIDADKPLIGINSGRLGYLCAVDLAHVESFNSVVSGAEPSSRSLLEVTLGGRVHYALNDITAAKERFGQTVDLTVTIDGEKPTKIRGDGLIISTPTGSTAYNLSSGGPVIDPSTDVYALTPICPHGKSIPPLVLSSARAVRIFERDNAAQIYADGADIGRISGELTVRVSSRTLSLYTGKSPLACE